MKEDDKCPLCGSTVIIHLGFMCCNDDNHAGCYWSKKIESILRKFFK